MDIKTLLIALMTLLSWGIGLFVAKLATNRIGQKAVFWDILGYAPVIVVFSLIFFKIGNLHIESKSGVFLAFLAGAIGGVCFYPLSQKTPIQSRMNVKILLLRRDFCSRQSRGETITRM